MNPLSIIISLFAVLLPFTSFAQKAVEHKKTSYIDSSNTYYQHVDLPVYLFISNSLDAQPKALQADKETSIKPIFLDGPGIHHLRHHDDIHKRIDIFKIYADGNKPVSSLVITGNKYQDKKANLYYGSNMQLKIQAKDDMSGVENTYFSLNGVDFQVFDKEVQIIQSGENKLQYYSVDRVGNVETINNFRFNIDKQAPKTFHNVVGIASGNTISPATFLYLTTSDELSGVASTQYAFDSEPAKTYNGKQIPVSALDNGEHTLYYWSIDQVGNIEQKQSFDFVLDKIAPIAAIDILGDKFIVDNKIYLSGRTKIKITAIDNLSGIKELKYSVNGQLFQTYTDPFYMPSKAGMYTIEYFAVDHSNNSSSGQVTQSKGVVYVDLLGPKIKTTLNGPNFKKGKRLYVGPKTKFDVQAKDGESGLKNIYYIINDGAEELYTKPLQLEDKPNGSYALNFIATDNVNNRNEEKMEVDFDRDGPDIEIKFSTKGEGVDNKVFPSYATIYVGATDAKTTTQNIYYSINDQPEQQYLTIIKGLVPNTDYTLKVRAQDVLENETIQVLTFRTADF